MNWSFIAALLAAAVVGLILYLRGANSPLHPHEQHELDIRLTYKRYMELYPHASITYQQYKDLQKRNAFRRSISSRKLKRMVR